MSTVHAVAQERNAYFDTLFNTPDLMWLGQNTNHAPTHPAVRAALHAAIDDAGFNAYAPPLGLEALRDAIVADLGLKGEAAASRAVVTDGAVAALALACRAFCGPGKGFVTTDPGWKWPLQFAARAGSPITEIPIYGDEHAFRLGADALRAATRSASDSDAASLSSPEAGAATAVIYLVDPNNPLGVCYTRDEIKAFADRAKEIGAILIHDCTYRDFAAEHTLAADFYPEGTVTIVSFSKWLGFAGLRLGALVAHPSLLDRILPFSEAPLGASVIAQKGALAGFSVKAEWLTTLRALVQQNQADVVEAVKLQPGLKVAVYPSHGNFLVIECVDAGVRPEALVKAFAAHGIMVRQGAYHTPRFGDRFIKVSLSVPRAWSQAFCDCLPHALQAAREQGDAPIAAQF
ncbi:pyridoxal phosphate-dependent aminotransferase [Robbsia sp. KACC 23696]|uniref:pyridoxal phosphate-dependent aminotransferase n=1 Tax=Robbsia sp. KACC 23696 TaxID=3149231 RepID=UPI00325B0DB4